MPDPLLPRDPLWTPARAASIAVAVLYAMAGLFADGLGGVIQVLMCLLLPLACIWYPEAIGSYTGWGLSWVSITAETPEIIVFYGGWVLLLLPLLLVPLMYMMG